MPGGVFPELNSGAGKPLPPDPKDSGRDETTAQAALRLLMMMVGSAGLAADRSLFWTILGSYAKNGQTTDKGGPALTTPAPAKLVSSPSSNQEPHA